MSACVIPLAPDFQDPVEVKNYPPVIDNTDPAIGADLSGDVARIRVRISDPNLSDYLYVRLVADYPPFDSNSRLISTELPGTFLPVSPPSTDPVRVHDTTLSFSCSSAGLVKDVPYHRITLVVADREIPSQPTQGGVYVPADGGLLTPADWIFPKSCP